MELAKKGITYVMTNTTYTLDQLIRRAGIYSMHMVRELEELEQTEQLNQDAQALIVEASFMFEDLAASMAALHDDLEREAGNEIKAIIENREARQAAA